MTNLGVSNSSCRAAERILQEGANEKKINVIYVNINRAHQRKGTDLGKGDDRGLEAVAETDINIKSSYSFNDAEAVKNPHCLSSNIFYYCQRLV